MVQKGLGLWDIWGIGSAYLKQGTAHFNMLISGSMSLAIPQRTSMFVKRVANSPSSFMLWLRMMSSIPVSSTTPCRSSRPCPSMTPNKFLSSFMYCSNFPFRIFCPLKLDRLQIIQAHSLELPCRIDFRKLMKFIRSLSSSLITIPTSIRVTSTFSLHSLMTFFTLSSSFFPEAYILFRVSLFRVASRKQLSSWFSFSLKKSATSPKTDWLFSETLTRILPPWQSAWMKLFFMSISKKVVAPILAMTELRGCLLVSKNVIGTPSTKDSIKTESEVSSMKGKGNFTDLFPLNISLKIRRLSFSLLKSI